MRNRRNTPLKIDYLNKPKESLEELLEKYNLNMYLIMDDVMASHKSFTYVYQQLIDMMKWGFEIAEIRKRPIHFKFHTEDKEIYSLQANHFISNMILWYAFMELDRVDALDETFIYDFTKFSMGSIVSYLDDRVLPLGENDFHSKNKIVDEVFYNITAVANAFCMLMGMSISMYDIMQAEKQCPEITEIIFGKVDPSLQPIEIEAELERRADRLIELFSQIDCDLKPLLVSGKNISKGQFKEMFVKIGLKSDINGNTIPLLIDANLVVDGLTKPSYQYIEACSARKSLIMTKQKMGEPGAFSKRINMLATSPSYLRHDYEDCNSASFITYHIKNEMILKLLDNRYYYDERGNLKLLQYPRDMHLLGKVVNFTSPCTCNSKEGICKKCYGELFEINKDLFSVGSYAATKASNPLGQIVLSSKHYQGTESATISFPDEFDDLFELSSTEISLTDNPKNDEELYLILDEVFTEQNDDVDFYYVTQFKIVNRKGNLIYNMSEDHNSNLYMSELLTSVYKKLKVKNTPIPLDDFIDDEDSVLFVVEIKNKELTEPIKLIEKILNKSNTKSNSLSTICQMLAESFIDIGIIINLVHIESIVKGLVRKKSNILEYPDWSRNGNPDDYTVLPVNSGLQNNPSPLVSISYGYIRKQLISPEFYEKNAPSHLDALFVRDLSNYID